MGKKLTEVETQVRQIIGDLGETNFEVARIDEAILFAQDLVMRQKGFNVKSRLYTIGAYPTGTLPPEFLQVKRVLVVDGPWDFTPGGTPPVTNADTDDTDDTVIRVLDESSTQLEDAANERWRDQRVNYMPRRWVLLGSSQFSIVPPVLPTNADPAASNYCVRVHYVKKSTFPDINTDGILWIDPSIPDYYQEALRYAAVAYLMEHDTDQKSVALKAEMMKSFEFHMAAGPDNLGVKDQDA